MLSALLLCTPLLVQEPAPAPLFETSLSPASELWCELRYQASLEGEPEGPLADAVRSARAIELMLGSPIVWGLVDAATFDAELGAFLAIKAVVPKRFLAEGRTRKELKPLLDELFAQLDSAASTWLEQEWPAREAKLLAVQRELALALDLEAQVAAQARIERWLSLTKLKAPVPVRLVTRSMPPGGVTVLAQGQAVCFIAVEGRAISTLAEVLLHEYLHALETQPVYPPSIFTQATRLLTQAKMRGAKLQRAWIHTVYFLAAADLVRAVVDPEHVDYGVSEGYYAKVPAEHAALAPLWRAYVNEEFGRTPFCQKLVAAAAALKD